MKEIIEGLNSSAAGPRPNYKNMENIPSDIAEKYRTRMSNLMSLAKEKINIKPKTQ